MTLLTVSVAIVVRNEKLDIEQCLASVVKQSYVPNEVVIIDSASTDGTSEICKMFATQYSFVHYYRVSHRGIGSARREAVWKTHCDYLAFLDGDCVAPENWLEMLMSGYQYHKSKDEHLAAVGGSHTTAHGATSFQSLLALLKTSRWASGSSTYRDMVRRDTYVHHIPTANVLYERKLLLETLPDDKFCISNEDVDVSLRLQKNGYRLLQVRGSTVFHKMQRSLPGWCRSMVRYGYGKMQLFAKHGVTNISDAVFVVPLAVLCVVPLLLFISIPILSILLLLYFLIITFESTRLALKDGSLYTFSMLLLLFPLTHIAYGIGELLFLLPIPSSLKRL